MLVFLTALAPALAQPVIFPKGIVNAASFMTPGLPGGGIARGSVFTIFGRGIGPAVGAQVAAFPLAATFQGVSIRVTQGNTSVEAIPVFVLANQVNAIMPSNTPLGLVSVRLTFNGARSNPSPVRVVDNSPGLFSATGVGAGPGVVLNFISESEQPVNTTVRTAAPGQAVILYGTGLGPIAAPDMLAPPAGNLPFPVAVFVGGKAAGPLLYSGRSPCCSGLDQIAFTVPADAPLGCYVPVQVRVGEQAVSNTVTMAIARDGAACSDAANPFSAPFRAGARTASIRLLRNFFKIEDGRTTRQFTVDTACGDFRREIGGELAFDPRLSHPPTGSCAAYTLSGDFLTGIAYPFQAREYYNVGALTLAGAAGMRAVAASSSPPQIFYSSIVGSTPGRGLPGTPLVFGPGTVQVRAPGTASVGPIDVNVPVAAPLDWTNQDQLRMVRRSDGLVVNWSGSGAGTVIVLGVSVDRPLNASGVFLCLAPPAPQSFTVPPYILANLPAARLIRGDTTGLLAFGSIPEGAPAVFSTTGLDFAAAFSRTMNWRSVVFR